MTQDVSRHGCDSDPRDDWKCMIENGECWLNFFSFCWPCQDLDKSLFCTLHGSIMRLDFGMTRVTLALPSLSWCVSREPGRSPAAGPGASGGAAPGPQDRHRQTPDPQLCRYPGSCWHSHRQGQRSATLTRTNTHTHTPMKFCCSIDGSGLGVFVTPVDCCKKYLACLFSWLSLG